MSDTESGGRMMRRGARLVLAVIRLHPRPFALALLGSAAYGVAVVASSYALGEVVDRVVVPRFAHEELSTAAMVAGALALLAVGVVKTASTVLRRCMSAVVKARSDASLREQVVTRYQALPYLYHQRRPTGTLLAHANADTEAAVEVPSKIPLAGGLVLLFVTAGVWIFVTDPVLAAVGVLIVPALVVLNAVYQRRIEPPSTLAQQRIGELSAVAHESFDGAFTVKVLGGEETERARFEKVAQRLREAKTEIAKRDATFDVLLESVPALTVVALVVAGAWRVNSGEITVGTLVSFINLFTLLTFPLRIIGYVLGDVPRSVAGYERVRGVLDEPLHPSPGTRTLPAGPLSIEAEGLAFGHAANDTNDTNDTNDGDDGGDSKDGPRIVDGVGFTVPPGSTLAVVGPTGSGKSTLLLLLARLLPLDGGTLRIGGTPVGDISAASLAASCATVFQEPFLFAASLEENILLGHEADAAQLREALRLSGADEFVDALPQGLATVVGERGVTLSGGQRQRVALARALVRRPGLLLLDDATSAVDPTTEARILGSLASERADLTTVIVANRPATLALADQVLYLDRARTPRVGTHQHLLATAPGYEDLVTAYETERAGGVR
ncbi:ABC transporter ATP-binding protein [Streptomyces sp. NPDC054796]